MILRHCLALLALLVAAPVAAPPAPPNPTVRIGLLLSQSSVRVSGQGTFSFMDAAGRRLVTAQPGEIWRVWPVPAEAWSSPDSYSLRPQPGDEVYLVGPDGKAAASSPLPVTVRPGYGHLLALDVGDRPKPYRGALQVTRAAEGVSLINLVPLESYLLGVVPCEMPPSYPAEALKAQAVAARTECLACIGRHAADGADMCATTHCQVYGGVASEAPPTTRAVESTAGEILTWQGSLARCLYSAVCGGHTENNDDVWAQEPLPYLRGQPDLDGPCPNLQDEANLTAYLSGDLPSRCHPPRYCKPQYYRWQVEMTRAELEEKLAAAGLGVGSVTKLTALARGVSGRIKLLGITGTEGERTVGPELAIRKALGGLKSSDFLVATTPGPDGLPDRFVFLGAGWGHGVGMCQVGAAGRAAAGSSYRQVLSHYYPGTTLTTKWRLVEGKWEGGS